MTKPKPNEAARYRIVVDGFTVGYCTTTKSDFEKQKKKFAEKSGMISWQPIQLYKMKEGHNETKF